jgi:hypothetical protein
MTSSVINSIDKQDAIASCAQFLRYYPYRYCGIVEHASGAWGYVTGKTMARLNTAARSGAKVYRVL